MVVSFADATWDGTKIPRGQQCKKFGGNGSTPIFNVDNIPIGTNAVILEFSDRSFFLMNHGGPASVSYYPIRGR
ncbi:MAG: hypothetical protein P8X88_05730 [Gammaproteobacteria bacterium]